MCHVQVRKLQQITSGCTVAAHQILTIAVLTENYQKNHTGGTKYDITIDIKWK
jgi:hypothetical protein